MELDMIIVKTNTREGLHVAWLRIQDLTYWKVGLKGLRFARQ